MKNSTVFAGSLIIVAIIGLLLTFNIQTIMKGKDVFEPYLKFNDVRGMAIEHKSKLYTLDFQEQNDVVYIINSAIHVLGVKPDKREKPEISKIIVYQFDNKPDIIITPIAYINQNLVFSSPMWNPDGLMMEVSQGELHKLLSKTYDP